MRIVITGGHHSSALPVMSILQEMHKNLEISWIGHRRSLQGDVSDTLEYREITGLGIPFFELHAGKFYKTYNLSSLIKIPYGFFQSLVLLARIRPRLIVSFGGYLAVPVVIAGWVLGIPSVTHEQTVVAGWANKVISRFAKKILVSWPSSLKYFEGRNPVLTGIPIRSDILTSRTNNFEFQNNLPVLYVTGGKTGSHKINDVVLESLGPLLSMCNVIWQCGDNSVYNDYEKISEYYASITPKTVGTVILKKFISSTEIGEVFLKANLLVSRSGAHTIAELIVTNKKAILIPIPWVSHNEQFENAKVLEELGLAKVISENTLNSSQLVFEVRKSLAQDTKLNVHTVALRNLFLGAAQKIALEIDQFLKE
jgi:UDP-N-acetylglucosamine--N-acetylmuramyl-(pentapeptide) pyrophosphoryl-undecaprenol N-acetylglucosamine transferase